ncbi:MAG: hypothetical protein V4819_06190 [Verrucomicrobiota bacterium]
MRILLAAMILVVALVITTVACTWGWERFVKDRIYNCTDDLPLDFLRPGHWVHQPVGVQQVTSRRSMSEPDAIKTGWSIRGLWLLWFSFVGGSVIVSLLLARLPWSMSRQEKT